MVKLSNTTKKLIIKKENSRRNAVVTIINNCNKDNLKFIQVLNRYYPVHIYGKCSNNNKRINLDELAQNYKFYLAFDDGSVCSADDNFYKILKFDIIPLVPKVLDHLEYVPTDGLIDAQKFELVSNLAEYLNSISKNSTFYNSFFNWKANIEFRKENRMSSLQSLVCDACIKLNLNDFNSDFDKRDELKISTTLLSDNQCYNFQIDEKSSKIILQNYGSNYNWIFLYFYKLFYNLF
jgi:hypothetical protein